MTKSKEPTSDSNIKKSSTKLPLKMPPNCVDVTAEALGTWTGIVGVNVPATKSKPSKEQ